MICDSVLSKRLHCALDNPYLTNLLGGKTVENRRYRGSPLANAIALALGVAAVSPAMAQEANQTVLEEVVVTGIRASMESSMNLKRDSIGVVDGIVAEDIGKFPDTNLAESLQRITGVSIDRVNGEGSRITVRGVGPDFNLVLLNGRQMPASSIEATTVSNSRAFDFANLASESIAAVEVYKTSRASIPTGGIGATINIKTARPLDNPGLTLNMGVKGVVDQSSNKSDTMTPEVSGIYSQTFADGMFGIAITGSYQDRKSGYNQAAVPGGWRTFKGDEVNWGTIPLDGQPGSENITNRPGPDDIYSVPQNINYSFNELERKRTNGQVTLQFRPVDAVTATLDYTYSELKIQQQRNELSAWFNFGPSVSSWTDGPVAAPIVYSETIVPANSDIAMAGSLYGTKNQNDSLGFNLRWEASDTLGFELDYHNSTAESGADSPYGSNNSLGVAEFLRGTTTVDFSKDFPVLSIDLPPGVTALDPAQMITTGSSFRNSYMKSEIEQAQLKGDLKIDDDSGLDFGVSLTTVKNRSAFSNVQQDYWGGVSGDSAANYPDSIWIPDTVRPYFSNISGSNNPNLFNQFFRWDFATVRAAAAAANPGLSYLPTDVFSTDRRVKEESKSAFLQYNRGFELADRQAHLAAGLRYEKTDVTSSALVPIANSLSWNSINEISINYAADAGFTTLKGKYDYLLPSLDFDVEVTNNVVARASYSETIGRPGWGDIQGGQTLDQIVRVDGGTGAQGDPGLKPLLSKNIDLSVEWYYAPGSYASVGYFHKSIDNYVGVTQVVETPFDLPNPAQGAYVDQAIADGGCASTDPTCIRNYIFTTLAGSPGVTVTGQDVNGNYTGSIVGQPGDPLTPFRITVPANQRSATLDGWELAVQHMFWDTGFGVSANLTLVDSNLKYDNSVIGEQFALEGLSDSANLVAFYEKNKWQARLAYNWRDQFLSGRFDGAGPNPVYTEPYGQYDMNVSYQATERLNVFVEGINVTNEIQRLHGRVQNQAEYVTQTGARYMIGARYNFGK
jgi:TonB-dependent receptor